MSSSEGWFLVSKMGRGIQRCLERSYPRGCRQFSCNLPSAISIACTRRSVLGGDGAAIGHMNRDLPTPVPARAMLRVLLGAAFRNFVKVIGLDGIRSSFGMVEVIPVLVIFKAS